MAKKSSIAKQKRREKIVASRWEQRQALKKTIKDLNTSDEERFAAIDKLNGLPRDSCPVRLRNRCSLTGRPRGFLRKFGLSRHCFREMASFGLIPGVTKSSW
jgi:small subunit ribosomal protein S14